MAHAADSNMNLPRAFLRECRRSKNRVKCADTLGKELTGERLLLGALVFRRLLLREVLGADEKFVGLLIPPSVGAILANVALPLAGRVAVNLNYTVTSEVMNSCIRQCKIKHVLTSRRVMEKLNLEIDAELVFLEDLYPAKITLADKLLGVALAKFAPLWLVEKLTGVDKIQDDDLLTVLFTSGSTGEPKGVMLSHKNVASNVQAIDQIVHLTDDDVAVGVMPFFHSYGYTATLWTMLSLEPKGIYHVSPLDAKIIGQMSRKHRATILMTTPTFLRSYTKRCEEEDFASLDVVFASAEKLPVEVCDAFQSKFGVRPVEAYGATEMSPLITLNVPASRDPGGRESCREGSVGRPIPGVRAKVIHPETGEDLPLGESGMLLVTGPNVMKGYYQMPDKTAAVVRQGWYVTGDIAYIDEDGFIHITGRQSRFSKIGGEMVPHIRIEETIQKVIGADEELLAAVTAVPDPRKGERLVVLHKPLDKSPEEIGRLLAEEGLPNLWIPGPDSFCEVDEIPVLGTGKLDLRRLKDMALERFTAACSA